MWFTHFLAITGRGLDLPLSSWEAHFMGHVNGLHHWKRKQTKCNITTSKTHAPSVPSHNLYVAECQWILSNAELQKNVFEGLRNIMNSILLNLEDIIVQKSSLGRMDYTALTLDSTQIGTRTSLELLTHYCCFRERCDCSTSNAM